MSRRPSHTLVALLATALFLTACGNGDRPGEGFVTVQSIGSGQSFICGQGGQQGQSGTFNILGSGFLSEHGIDVTVVMIATTGTPFDGGTNDRAELAGTVIHDGLIASALPVFAGQAEVTLTVILPGGNEGVSLPGTVTIGGFLDGPYAFIDNYVTDVDAPLTVPADMGPLVNDFGRQCIIESEPGPQNSPPSVTGFTIDSYDTVSANGGTITMGPDGAFTYTPPTGFEGFDNFSYTMNDGGFTSSSTVFVGVNTGNNITKPSAR